MTALGTDTKATGVLRPDAMERTLAGLSEAFLLAQMHGAGKPLAAGTMALRIAKNAEEFQRSADAQGTPVTILPGDEEARLGFLAVANDPTFNANPSLAIIDIGGHSTEVVIAQQSEAGWIESYRKSHSIGTLGLLSGVMSAQSPDSASRFRATTEIDRALELLPAAAEATTVSLGATGTNLVSIREKLTSWEPDRVHGTWLETEEVARSVGQLCDLDDEGRRNLVGIEPGRERTLHIGALILERCLYALAAEQCGVSVRGWRHALLEETWPISAQVPLA